MTTRHVPAHRLLYNYGELAGRAHKAMNSLQCSDLCARYCYVIRIQSIKGAGCRTGECAIVHNFGPHHGEKKPSERLTRLRDDIFQQV